MVNLAAMVYQVQRYQTRYVLNINTRRPMMPLKVQGAHGWHTIDVLADTGNDITLITKADAQKIGIDYEREGAPFMVSGVGGGANKYYLVKRLVQIGNLQPRVFRIGVGDPPVNLLGREDTAAYYRITFEGVKQIVFEELNVKAANITTASGVGYRQQMVAKEGHGYGAQ